MTDFVHLHLHTEYSLLDGAAKVDDLIDHLVKNNINACAITDHGNMYASLYFAEECVKKGIKYIIGCELYAVDDHLTKQFGVKNEHIVLLAKNKTGYKNIVKLDSLSYIDGYYGGKPRISYDLIKKHHEGVICLSACLAGRLPQLLLKNDYEAAKAWAAEMKGIFGEDFYIELQDHGIEEQKQILPDLIKIARELDIQLVATNDVHYIEKEDWEAHDILICIQTKSTLANPPKMRFEKHEFYMKSGDEMAELFHYIPEAITNTRVIADKIEEPVFDITPKGDPIRDTSLIPLYKPDDGSTSPDYLTRLTWEGLKGRYENITQEIKDRVNYELGIIIKMGFADYFLIVWDYINWSRLNGIPVGPGRGSGVGSIVAYSIGITDVDPLRYDLLFERFLNPDRVSMPDFDVDFCTKRRYETIEYVRKKYHPENVAQIVTFGTLASRAVIKDVGRVMGVPYSETDKVAKLMDGKSTIGELLGLKIPKLEKQIENEENEEKRAELQKKLAEQKQKRNSEFIEVYETNDELHRVIDMGLKLEGMPKNTSEHAAGVVICNKVLSDNVPLARNGDDIVTQFDMKEVEAVGMLKMDFLALTTLTDIQNTLEYIKEGLGIDIDFNKIGVDVPEAYQLISSGDTDAVFQLEQGGMKKFMKDLQPTCLEDLIAGISLYRPGPMDFIPKYIENKHYPERIVYDTPFLEPILKNSYGVIIYQEQVMQIFQQLAGYSLGQADLVRRAMAKKKKKELMEQKDKFIYGSPEDNITGCASLGIPAEVAAKIFADMESFASYAFNKSHAAAYAVVAYRTAYLKAFYPKEFLAGILNDRIDKIDEVSKYIIYMKEKNIDVLPPDINKSKDIFWVEGNGLRIGLGALRGVGQEAIAAVIKERNENGAFKDFPDFAVRCAKYVNKRIVESLIYAGAFDSFGYTRSQFAAVYEEVLSRVSARDKQNGGAQLSLFTIAGGLEEMAIEIDYPNIPEYEKMEKLSKEKSVLGVYVSGHPFEKFLPYFKNTNFNCAALNAYTEDEETGIKTYTELSDGMPVTMGGMISAYKKLKTKSGQFMAFVTVEDLYGSVECVCFPKVYERIRPFLESDKVVSVSGKMSIDAEKLPAIIVDKMTEFTLDEKAPVLAATQQAEMRQEPREKPDSEKRLWLNVTGMDEADIEELMETLTFYAGETAVVFVNGGKKMLCSQKVSPNRALMAELSSFLDEKCIKIV